MKTKFHSREYIPEFALNRLSTEFPDGKIEISNMPNLNITMFIKKEVHTIKVDKKETIVIDSKEGTRTISSIAGLFASIGMFLNLKNNDGKYIFNSYNYIEIIVLILSLILLSYVLGSRIYPRKFAIGYIIIIKKL